MNVVLDLDGTLISCEPRQSAVLRAALIGSHARADVEDVWERKRNGATTERALVQQGMDSKLAQRVSAEWRRMIEEPLWLAFDTVLPGVHEALGRLRAVGATLWLATARSRREWVPIQLAQLGLSRWLDRVTVVASREASIAKVGVLREASPIAFFGDTESDWLAAATAGVSFYAVASGQRSSSYLTASGVDRCCADLSTAVELFHATLEREKSG